MLVGRTEEWECACQCACLWAGLRSGSVHASVLACGQD